MTRPVGVHEPPLQAGGLAVAEHRAEQRVAEVAVEVGGRVGQPVADRERGQRGVRVGHGLARARRPAAARRTTAGRASAGPGCRRSASRPARQRLVDVEVARDRDQRVARRVVGVEERRGVVEGGLLQLGEVAVAVVRVGERVVEDRRQQDPGEPAVGPVEDVEPDLLLDDVDLVAQVLLGERRGAQPVGLQEQRPLQRRGGQHLEVVGVVLVGGAVEDARPSSGRAGSGRASPGSRCPGTSGARRGARSRCGPPARSGTRRRRARRRRRPGWRDRGRAARAGRSPASHGAVRGAAPHESNPQAPMPSRRREWRGPGSRSRAARRARSAAPGRRRTGAGRAPRPPRRRRPRAPPRPR